AIATFQRGLEHLRRLRFHLELSDQLQSEMQQSERALLQERRSRLRADLHRLAEKLRRLYGVELTPAARAPLAERCRAVWAKRAAVAEELEWGRDPAAVTDFLDIALLWAEWQAERRQALRVLAEAEALFGAGLVLDFERRRLEAPGRTPLPPKEEPKTA